MCNHFVEHYNWIICRQFLGNEYIEYQDQKFPDLESAKKAVYKKHKECCEILEKATDEIWNTKVKGRFSEYPRIQVASQAFGHAIWHAGEMREIIHFSRPEKYKKKLKQKEKEEK